MVHGVWKWCNMVFEGVTVPEDWKNVVIVPLYKGKGERIECRYYRHVSLQNIVEKIYE